MTEKALVRQPAALSPTRPTAVQVAEIPLMDLCQHLARSGFFKNFSDASKAMVAVAYGSELGLTPIASVMNIHIIEGKPCLSATVVAALIDKTSDCRYRVSENTAERCVLEALRGGEALGRIEWTMDMARNAGLAGKDNWKKWPRRMLFCRALAELARTYFAHIFTGSVYIPEELGAEVDAQGDVITVPGESEPLPPVVTPNPDRAIAEAGELIRKFGWSGRAYGPENRLTRFSELLGRSVPSVPPADTPDGAAFYRELLTKLLDHAALRERIKGLWTLWAQSHDTDPFNPGTRDSVFAAWCGKECSPEQLTVDDWHKIEGKLQDGLTPEPDPYEADEEEPEELTLGGGAVPEAFR